MARCRAGKVPATLTPSIQAFTLVEISIVLVIIALLIGSVLMGQNLLRAQSLRNVLQDAKTYAIAKQLFADKYGSLPGDMPDATRVWGRVGGGAPTSNCAAPATDVSVGNTTCNGNGNGIIELSGSENFRAWQHLSAAGMITGKFTGVYGSAGGTHSIPGSNVPAGSVNGSGFYFNSWGEQAGGTTFFAGNYNNAMIFGGVKSNDWTNGGALYPSEAFEMDKKVDDGLPGMGHVRTFARTWMLATVPGDCVSSDTPATATYSTSLQVLSCFLVFTNTFQAKPQ